MKIKLSKKNWEETGKKAGWIKVATIVSDCCGAPNRSTSEDGHSFSDLGICPACREHCEFIEEGEEISGVERMDASKDSTREIPERLRFSYGTTPESIIKKQVQKLVPNGYNMTIRNQREWVAIAKAVNQGIDSHLEGFTRSKFDNKTGECLVHPEEMTTFLRRLMENGDEESMDLRGAILITLEIEEV